MNDSLQSVFITVLNLSLTGSVALLAVLALRPALKRAPKALTAALWCAPLFRLLCPVSFRSVLSIFTLLGTGGAPQLVPANIATMPQPQVDLFVPPVSHAVSQALPAATPYASINPMQVYLYLGALVWAVGALALALWGVFSYIQLKFKLRTATRDGDVWRTDHTGAPFLAGLLRPRIYVPEDLGGEPLALILRHERAHLRHGDPWVKALWYAALCIHWFNPLVWLALRLTARDMELHADEAALRPLNESQRADYCDALLRLCRPRRALTSPLAFGESDAPGRIRRALSYKRPAFWVVLSAVAIIAVIVVALTANPFERTGKPDATQNADLAAKLYAQRTLYIGDNSKVGAILNLLPYPTGVRLDSFELQTKEANYGVIARMTANSAYHREDVSELLKWEDSAAVLFALVSNSSWMRFDVTMDGKTEQYMFSENTLKLTHGDIESIRGGDKAEASLANLIAGIPSSPRLRFDLQSVDAAGQSLGFMQIVTNEDDALLLEISHAYATASDTGLTLPAVGGYKMTFHYSETLGDARSLLVVRDGQQVLAQLTGNANGAVRKLDAWLYPQLEALYQRLAAKPVETAKVTAAPMGKHYVLTQLSNGEEIATRTDFSSEEQYLMDSVFFDHAIRSAAWPALNVDAMESCYRLRIYADPAQPTELYVFRKDGAACAQLGRGGMYSAISEDLFQQIGTLLPIVKQTPGPSASPAPSEGPNAKAIATS